MNNVNVSAECGCDGLEPSSGADLMRVSDARTLALAQVAPLRDGQTVALSDALGRTTRRDIRATAAMPYFDNSAMDGFALRCADLAGDRSLPIAGTVAAGDAPRALPDGAALRIYTGAPLPVGADAVVMVEQCNEVGGRVEFNLQPRPGDNIRRAGSDQASGQILVPAGTRLAPRHVGLLAANGITRVEVVRPPRLAVFSSGNEVSDAPRAPGQIPDANRPMLLALAAQAGADVTDMGILPDDPGTIADALDGLDERFDLVLTSGAVSMGGKDNIRGALVAAGGSVTGWRVALKPGKPVMFGRLGSTAVTGLPGNPFAVHVGFHLFVAPQIARLAGTEPAPFAPVPARAGFSWRRKPGRAEVFPVRLRGYDAGLPILERLGRSVSATLFPLARADGLAIVPAGTDRVRPGDPLRWQPFGVASAAEDPHAP